MDMLKHWQELFNTDCDVVKIKNEYLYPIYKCGSTSLLKDAKQIIKNYKIKKLKKITVLIREPKERFISGVVTYAEQVNKPITNIMKEIKANTLCNRHFAPQFVWLMQLHMYYRGDIEIKPFTEIKNYTKKNINNFDIIPKTKITPLKNYIAVDQKMIKKYMNKKIKLSKVFTELIDDVLS